MTKSFYLVGLTIAVAIVVLLVFLFTPSPPVASKAADVSSGQGKAAPRQSNVFDQAGVSTPSNKPPTRAASPSRGEQESASDDGTPTGKEKSLEKIHEAMVTYSEEGLPVIKPYLSHPDSEVRVAAIDAVINLAVPAGADVLRQASKTARNSEEQIKMIQGADFLELPRIPLDLLKQIVEQRAAARTPQAGQPAPSPAATGR